MGLRVAVDATALPRRRLGAGVYLVELLRAMSRLDVVLEVFATATNAPELAALVPGAHVHPVRLPSRPLRLAWSHARLGPRVRRLWPDVMFGPHYTLPPRARVPGVVTFHDPTFFTHPELHERAKVAYFRRTARRGIARAVRVIVPSEYSWRGAVEYAGARSERVVVVPEGVDHARYRPAPPSSIAPQTRERRVPLVLFVGAIEPRKDLPTLLEAMSRLRSPAELVVCGPPAWGVEAVERTRARLGLDRVRFTGFVSEDEKIALYQSADVFVYPSIAEGFGIPVLEAMACGTPVVTTTGSGPEEVAGGAALLIPPRSPEALALAIDRVLSDPGLRADLVRRGLGRARAYSWERAARNTLRVLEEAAGG